jgi:hypothetical protein
MSADLSKYEDAGANSGLGSFSDDCGCEPENIGAAPGSGDGYRDSKGLPSFEKNASKLMNFRQKLKDLNAADKRLTPEEPKVSCRRSFS